MKAITIIVILFFSGTVVAHVKQIEMPNNTKKEAERIWELMIEAKGGRDRLHKIETIVKHGEGSYYAGLKKIKSHTVDVIVFPNKWWTWADDRPSVFGLRMTMYNFDINRQYVVQFNGVPAEWGLETIEAGNRRFAGMTFSCYLLPENKYWKPTVEGLSIGRVGSNKVDVIQTRLNGNRVDFSLDKKSHLPVKISFFQVNPKDNADHRSYETYLSEYVDNQGIRVPTKVDNQKYRYQFNVEFNEEIFTKPPLPVESAADAWKPNRKTE
ncbi:MAG: hypothetical protein AB7V18_11315 [Pyrinomonadaceae bacterium]